MGKEWYWASSSGSSGSNNGRSSSNSSKTSPSSGCMSAVFQFFDFHHFQLPLHHHHQQPLKPTAVATTLHLPDDEEHHAVVKGAEAPRNSLELEQPPLPSSFKKQENLNIPMGIQVKTRKSNSGAADAKLPKPVSTVSDYSSSEAISSPSAKTPNLVARLMGLDLLPPEATSPSSFHESSNFGSTSNFRPSRQSNSHNVTAGTRSLPETPRISSARRSDVDHHRLSLQINKENHEDYEFSRFSCLKRKELKQEDEYRSLSPGHYARQIVKQVKESVNRKVGLDITNTLTTRNREPHQQLSKDEIIHQIKSKKPNSKLSNKSFDHQQTTSSSTPSCSPRLSRFVEPKQKPDGGGARKPLSSVQVNNDGQSSSPGAVKVRSKLQPVAEEEKVEQLRREQRPPKKCKRVVSEKRFTTTGRMKKPPQTTDIIRNKQEEPFVRASTGSRVNSPDHKKCKKTPLSSELVNITVPTLLPVKKDPPRHATKLPQKQQVLNAQCSKCSSQLSSIASQTYKQQTTTHNLVLRDNYNDVHKPDVAVSSTPSPTADTSTSDEESEYITRILKRTGIDLNTPVTFISWFSPSHPLDPSIFQHVENVTVKYGQLKHQCNRKLLFHLVDEVLIDLLKPLMNMKPWLNGITACSNVMNPRGVKQLHGSQLIDTCCSIVKSFPRADCQVLEDIDALIDGDLPKINMIQNDVALEEEGEGIVTEIEKDILDSLILETTADFRVSVW